MPKFFDIKTNLRPSKKQASHPLYPIWYAMRFRCYNEKCKEYKNYGGRGITVCERWKDLNAFVQDMGSKPTPRHTLERVDNDGNYDPFNCVWATRTEQNKNRRPNQKRLKN